MFKRNEPSEPQWAHAPVSQLSSEAAPPPATQVAELSHLNGLEWRSLLRDPIAREAAAADPDVRKRVIRSEAGRLALSEAVEMAVLARISERRRAQREG